MVSGHRTFLRVGGIWLLLSAVGHSVFHWFMIMRLAGLDPVAELALDALRATEDGAELWARFNQFSLAFVLFLLLAGTASVIASRKSVPVREARHWSGFAGAFWVLAFVVFLFEPVAAGLIIAGAAAFFHIAAFAMAGDGATTTGPAWEAATRGSRTA